MNEVSEEIGQLQQDLRLALEAENDPQYAPLLEVIVEKCPALQEEWRGYGRVSNQCVEDGVDCEYCHGTCYVLRDWSGLPKGALAGAGYRAMRALHLQDPSLATFRFVELWWSDMRSDANPDPATLKAILAAVLARKKEA